LSLMIFSFLCSVCWISLLIALKVSFCVFTSLWNFWTLAYWTKNYTIWGKILTKYYGPTTNQSPITLLGTYTMIGKLWIREFLLLSKSATITPVKQPKHLQTNLCYTCCKGAGDKIAKDQIKMCDKGFHNLYSLPIILLWWRSERGCDGKKM
jgi:hypothetical protein